MKPDESVIRKYFAKLGLEAEIADLYLALHAYGPQTISALSRNARVERTRVYRLLDKLMASNLIEVESHYKRGVIKAAPITNLRILINEREQELKNLTDELEMVEQVLARNSLSSPATRVQFYSGPEGYKQALWNTSRTTTGLVTFCYEVMQPHTKKAFFDRYVTALNATKLPIRELHSDHFIESRKNWYATNTNVQFTAYETRYVAPDSFPIMYNMDVYDDVTTYYQWKDAEIFSFEIYNQQIADSNRAVFEMLWTTARPDQHATDAAESL